MIAEVGSNQWRAFRELSPAAPVMPAEEVAAEPDVAAAMARPAGYAPTMAADHGHSLAGVRAVDDSALAAVLPAGETVHAGFWRRVAAYFIDGFLVGILAWIVGIVLILGVAA